MTSHDRDPQTPDDSHEHPLEFNKETLQDLDLEAGDADGVKGGGGVVYPVIRVSYQATETGTLSGGRGSGIITSSGGA